MMILDSGLLFWATLYSYVWIFIRLYSLFSNSHSLADRTNVTIHWAFHHWVKTT